ncbi:MAG: universal stress protein [Acidobacteria bacterium]|nr:universal stress protein [Acidobacteriota bacterium]
MYKRILIAVEHSAADRTIVDHIQPLARLCGARLLLVHVADGWVARAYDDLKLRESKEIVEDRAYLESLRAELAAAGFTVDVMLAMGDPATELVRIAEAESVDLVAMATHGHRFLKDVILGATADKVRHALKVPVLLLQAPSAGEP